jgi:hypothetical protein
MTAASIAELLPEMVDGISIRRLSRCGPPIRISPAWTLSDAEGRTLHFLCCFSALGPAWTLHLFESVIALLEMTLASFDSKDNTPVPASGTAM